MNQAEREVPGGAVAGHSGTVDVLTLDQVKDCPRWRRALANQRKDHRYYEIVED